MAGVHLEECVSGFALGGKWNVGGLSGEKRERKGDFWHSGIGESWESFLERNRREGEKKNMSEGKR